MCGCTQEEESKELRFWCLSFLGDPYVKLVLYRVKYPNSGCDVGSVLRCSGAAKKRLAMADEPVVLTMDMCVQALVCFERTAAITLLVHVISNC